MNNIHKIMISLNLFSLGLMIPVLNLILLERGATLTSLAMLLAIYSGTVLLFELPSGICADLFGRKAIFLLSCGFNLLSFLLLLMSSNLIWLAAAMMMNGLGRAFSSGSLDALIIDEAIRKNGNDVISKVSTAMAVLEGVALSLGSIIGGMIASVSNTYNLNILFRITITLFVSLLCFFYIKEMHENKTLDLKSRILEIKQTRETNKEVRMRKLIPLRLWLILAGIFFTGFLLNTIETYWQPAFKELTVSDKNTWLLGVISFFGFMAVTLGNIVIGKILAVYKNHWWLVICLSRIIFGIMIIIFSFQQKIAGFVLGYTGVYLLLGSVNVAENAIINQMIPGNLRASFLSLSSLLLQIGALTAAIFCSILINSLHFSGLWLLTGLFVSGNAIVVIVILAISKDSAT